MKREHDRPASTQAKTRLYMHTGVDEKQVKLIRADLTRTKTDFQSKTRSKTTDRTETRRDTKIHFMCSILYY